MEVGVSLFGMRQASIGRMPATGGFANHVQSPSAGCHPDRSGGAPFALLPTWQKRGPQASGAPHGPLP